MTRIWTERSTIVSDGIDSTTIYIDGAPDSEVTYKINNEVRTALLERVDDLLGRDTVEISCDTPNTTILIECEGIRIVILAMEVAL